MAVNVPTRMKRRFYRIPRAVEYLNSTISAKTLRQWIWRRKIPFVRIGGAVCIAEEVLDGMVEDVPAEEYFKRPRKIPRSQIRSGENGKQNV
jgi:excisionase family DNA binding protein